MVARPQLNPDRFGARNPRPEGAIVSAQPLRIGLQKPCIGLQDPAVAQAAVEEAEIDTGDGIVQIGIRVALRDDKADRGFFQNAQRSTPREHVATVDLTEIGLPYGQSSNAPGTDPPAQLAPMVQVHGLARIAESQAPGEERPAVFTAGP